MRDRADDSLVAHWRAGDERAAAEQFRRYADRLIALARSRLSAKLAQRIDPEDVVQSAYRSFFANSRDDRYNLERGGDLWQLLVTITLHKLNDQVKWNSREKRGADKERTFGSEDSLFGMQAQMLAHDPSPVEAVALADELEQFMRQLEPLERRMLELRLQGYNLDEIAAQTQRCRRTVWRVLEEAKQDLQQRYFNNSGT